MSLDFDSQAAGFDERAGLPETAVAAIARAVAERVPAGALLLDIGAGTGQLGVELARLQPRYVGLDLSMGMLHRFRQRKPAAGLLIRADATVSWPLRAGSVGACFLSRSAHLLEPEHLARELIRTVDRGGLLLVGRVRRDPTSVRARMRARLHTLLRERGASPREGRARALEAALVSRGCRPLPSVEVTRYHTPASPGDALRAWRSKPGLAGLDLDPPDQGAILEELEAWARTTFGELDTPLVSEELYELELVALSGDSG